MQPFDGLITLIVFLPVAGAAVIAVAGREQMLVRRIALGAMILNLILATYAWLSYSANGPIIEQLGQYGSNPWIPGVNASYLLTIDGLSMPLVFLTALLGVVAVLGSWHVKERVREYHVWLLMLLTGVQGVFVAGDLLLFFLFWEVELVPMYFLIAMWGAGHREYSAMKFVLYTLFGSAFMLVGVLALRFAIGSFDMGALTLAGQEGTLRAAFLSMDVIFLMFLAAFAIKLPVWPLHTWLPDAHTDAPTAVSVLLAGVLLKMGGYGLIRINVGMFPSEMEQWAPLLVIFSVVSILYGAAVVFRQTDLKRLVAYSSVSHMGLVLLGVASLGAVSVTGAALQMFAHGTITGLLFLVVGIIYENAHTRHIPDLGGLFSRMPVVGAVFVFAGLASLGLPLLSGFAAELMVFLGSFDVYPWQTAFAVLGIVLTAGYILWTVERVLLGPLKERWNSVKDASPADFVAMALLVLPIIIVGVYPALVADVFRDAVTLLVGGG